MNISAAGAGSPNLDPQALRILATVLADFAVPLPTLLLDSAHDSVSPSLGALATPSIQLLLKAVDDHLAQAVPQSAASIHALDPVAIKEFLNHPAQALTYGLDAVTLEARSSAEKSVAKATHAIETGEDRTHRVPEDLNPRAVVALANQFIATGQFPNYLRAGELGRIVTSWYDGPSPAKSAVPARERQILSVFRGTVKNLWRRAPLLLLLTGWLMLGAVSVLMLRMLNIPSFETTLALDIWAVGFLALIVFQFVVTIRRGRPSI